MTFRFLSVCSGLEGASLAFEPLGARAVGFAEIEAFPSAIIAHHYGSNMPGETLSHNAPPNFGDFTTIDVSTLGQVDLLVGGTPCQAFSIAGKRLSLADARGNLTLAYAVLAHELARSNGLRNALWENVPGVLSAKDNAFGCFLGQLVGADDALRTPDGRSWPNAGMVAGPQGRAAWRVLDAQYFGLAQRRRRVFLVADFGNGADPAAVLFERQSLHGNTAPRRKTGQGVAAATEARSAKRGSVTADIAPTLNAHFGDKQGLEDQHINGGGDCSLPSIPLCLNAGGMGRLDAESETLIPVNGGVFDDALAFDARQSEVCIYGDRVGTLDCDGHSQAIVFGTTQITSAANYSNPKAGDPSHPFAAGAHAPAVAFDLRGREGGAQFEGPHDTANIRAASGGSSRSYVAQQWAVRRLTPEECEALQGVPRNYTRIPWRGKPAEQCPDGPRYKALGNSWAVPVVRWIGKRLVESMP